MLIKVEVNATNDFDDDNNYNSNNVKIIICLVFFFNQMFEVSVKCLYLSLVVSCVL